MYLLQKFKLPPSLFTDIVFLPGVCIWVSGTQSKHKQVGSKVYQFIYLSSSWAFSMAARRGEALVSTLTPHSAIPPIEHSSIATGPQKQALPMHHCMNIYPAACAIRPHNLSNSQVQKTDTLLPASQKPVNIRNQTDCTTNNRPTDPIRNDRTTDSTRNDRTTEVSNKQYTATESTSKRRLWKKLKRILTTITPWQPLRNNINACVT